MCNVVRLILVAVIVLGATLSFAQSGDSTTASEKYICPPCGHPCDKQTFDKPGKCPGCGMPLITKSSLTTYNVAIVVYDGVELLDFAGPGEVFQAAAKYSWEDAKTAFNVYTVAPSNKPIVSQGFVTITPEYTIENCPEPDIVVLPGGRARELYDDPIFMKWAKSAVDQADIALSVCTGAFVFAKNGQLDGIEATTHWGAIKQLRKAAPKTTVLENIRFVDNGRIVTTAGVSAGIDGALHVVAKLISFEIAKETARYMEYAWKPGPQTKALSAASIQQVDDRDEAFKAARALIRDRKWKVAAVSFDKLSERFPDDAEIWYYVGLTHHYLENWDRAIVAHKRAASLPDYYPQRPLYNLACAYALTGKTELALDTLEKAIEAGWNNKIHTLTDKDLEGLGNLPRFKALVEPLTGGRFR